MQIPTVREIYDTYLQHLNEQKVLQRYQDRSWFHSSTAGLCTRKHFFASVMEIEGASIDEDTRRLFRLGDIVHEDIQQAVRWWAESNAVPIFIEKELYLEDLNVRGFIDLAFVYGDTLHDIKTCNSFKWRMMFGKKGDKSPSINYQLQLATYGLWYEREYGSLQDMTLIFYNKDNSKIREVGVPIEMIETAREYWEDVNNMIFKNGTGTHPNPYPNSKHTWIPEISLGTAPVYAWECNPKYCQYYDMCGGGIKGEKNE